MVLRCQCQTCLSIGDLPLRLAQSVSPLQAGLLEERDVGVLNAAVTLLLGIVSRNYEGGPQLRPPSLALH